MLPWVLSHTVQLLCNWMLTPTDIQNHQTIITPLNDDWCASCILFYSLPPSPPPFYSAVFSYKKAVDPVKSKQLHSKRKATVANVAIKTSGIFWIWVTWQLVPLNINGTISSSESSNSLQCHSTEQTRKQYLFPYLCYQVSKASYNILSSTSSYAYK